MRIVDLDFCIAKDPSSNEILRITEDLKHKSFRLEGRENERCDGVWRKVMIDREEFGPGRVKLEISRKDGILPTVKGSRLWVRIHSLAKGEVWEPPIVEEVDSRPL